METRRSIDDRFLDVCVLLMQIPADTGGGCSDAKAYLFASLIREYSLKSTLDIGIYKGRSLFPQAIAHKRHTGGVVYGVDPFSAEEAREEELPEDKREAIEGFFEGVDFEEVYKWVMAIHHDYRFAGHCAILRTTSAAAADYFAREGVTFDLIHIDGNHDTQAALGDVELYLPLLRDGGFVVLDDVSWESTRPAYDTLTADLSRVIEVVEGPDDYALFRKGPPEGYREFALECIERAGSAARFGQLGGLDL